MATVVVATGEQGVTTIRAIIELFRVPEIADVLVFRGGTALCKLYLDPPARYSEDIDLVQSYGLRRSVLVTAFSLSTIRKTPKPTSSIIAQSVAASALVPNSFCMAGR